MAEYIEREALLKRLKFKVETDTTYYHLKQRGLESAMAQVRKAPAADVVEVKRGRWTAVKPTGVGATARCSICGDAIYGYHTMNFCPNCGCLMGGD